MPDHNVASDRISVAAGVPIHCTAAVSTDLMVERWDADQAAWAARKARAERERYPGWEPGKATLAEYGLVPYSTTVDENCNNFLSAGWGVLLAVASRSATIFSATVGRIGIGDSTTAVSFTQTDLQAATNKQWVLCGVAPTVQTASSPASWTFTASFTGTLANFAWQEFATDQGTASNTGPVVATCFNRGLSSQGTKTSGQVWTVTETIQFGFPSGSGTVS